MLYVMGSLAVIKGAIMKDQVLHKKKKQPDGSYPPSPLRKHGLV